jgi:hypothetical protein
MPLSKSRTIGTTVAVDVLILVALAFAVVGYVEWSSDSAWSEYMSAAKLSASDTDHSNESSAAQSDNASKTGCPVGKRKFPTQVRPLP